MIIITTEITRTSNNVYVCFKNEQNTEKSIYHLVILAYNQFDQILKNDVTKEEFKKLYFD